MYTETQTYQRRLAIDRAGRNEGRAPPRRRKRRTEWSPDLAGLVDELWLAGHRVTEIARHACIKSHLVRSRFKSATP